MSKSPVAPPPPSDPRYRLQKGDWAFMVKSLSDRGYKVHVRKGERIDAYDPVTNEFLCGFTWNKGTATTPGRWTFDFTMADVFSLKDLKTVITEAQRVTSLRKHAQTAWEQFMETKSDKRWSQYLGIVAALFAGRTPDPKKKTVWTTEELADFYKGENQND